MVSTKTTKTPAADPPGDDEHQRAGHWQKIVSIAKSRPGGAALAARWNLALIDLLMKSQVGDSRERFRKMRRILKRMDPLVRSLHGEARQLLSLPGPCVLPDSPKDAPQFLRAIEALQQAFKDAVGRVPPSGNEKEETDPELKRAPRLAEFDGALIDRLSSLGFPVSGAPLAHLAAGIGLEPPATGPDFHQDNRKKWDQKLVRRRHRVHHTSTGTHRAKKRKRS